MVNAPVAISFHPLVEPTRFTSLPTTTLASALAPTIKLLTNASSPRSLATVTPTFGINIPVRSLPPSRSSPVSATTLKRFTRKESAEITSWWEWTSRMAPCTARSRRVISGHYPRPSPFHPSQPIPSPSQPPIHSPEKAQEIAGHSPSPAAVARRARSRFASALLGQQPIPPTI